MKYNQVEYAKVIATVIEPLERHYGAEFDKAKSDDYINILKIFSEAVLREAMQEVLQTSKRAPAIAHIVSACRDIAPRPHQNPETKNFIAELQKKYDTCFQDAKKFTNDFMSSAFGIEATQEGWGDRLRAYVFAQAHLQALFLGRCTAGWNANDLFNYDTMRRNRATDEEINFRKNREVEYALHQLVICVSPPHDLIAEWKAECRFHG